MKDVQGNPTTGFSTTLWLVNQVKGEVESNEVTIVATKVLCDSESLLPNWGADDTGTDITSTTATEYVAASNGGCHIVPEWEFQWSGPNGNPGDNLVGSAGVGNEDYANNPFGGDASLWSDAFSGSTTAVVPAVTSQIWVREVFPTSGYVPFRSFNNRRCVSRNVLPH
ncbi:MAG: hypothetical protein R3B65_02560 [Candidatus Paceibacterota bacterium]